MYTRLFRGIVNGQVFDENFLMTIATFGAFGVGEYSEAVAVMLFYQVGELFQSYAVSRSRQSIADLMDICPEYANLEKDGELVQTDPDDVEIGDIIVIKPGERIPLDGTVISGESMVDTSALTGESVPRRVETGSEIISGCINESGVLRVEVTKEFDDSTVARILELVENASSKKAQVENFITRFARYYSPGSGDCGCSPSGCASSCAGRRLWPLDSESLHFPGDFLSLRPCYFRSSKHFRRNRSGVQKRRPGEGKQIIWKPWLRWIRLYSIRREL